MSQLIDRAVMLIALIAAAGAAAGAAAATFAGPAAAQSEPDPVDIEVPTVVLDTSASEDGGGGGDDELDLANVVQSAAKGVTTVQEAPAIVTVITADDIRERQFQTLDQVLDTVPGYMRNALVNNQFPDRKSVV